MPDARHGIFLAPFDELYQPALVAELAVRAEQAGWHGFFLWDHVEHRAPVRAVADPWITLAAVAVATEHVTIGPMVTPLARRRAHKLARETVTLDHLSGGRLVLGAGLGSGNTPEFDPDRFGEEGDPKVRARLLDEGLDRLAAYWDGDFEPPPVQQPRIPVWIASRWPSRRPLKRAARWDGMFPIEMPGPGELAELVAEAQSLRTVTDVPFEVVVAHPAGTEWGPWIDAGATWCLTEFGPRSTRAEVQRAIEAGPG